MLLRFFNTAAARLLLCIGILAALAMVAADRFVYRTSIDAIVNAPRIDVVAPAEGVLTELPVAPGVAVSVGTTVAALQRTSWSQGVADEIGLRVAQQRAQVAALDSELLTLTALRSELRARIARHRASSLTQLGAEERALAASAQEHRLMYARLSALHAAQSATNAELEAAKAASVRSAAALARVREARRAVSAGIVTEGSGGAQDVPYSQQRADDLTIQLARLAADRAMASAQLQALGRELNEPAIGNGASPTGGPEATGAAAAVGAPDSAGAAKVIAAGAPGATGIPGTITLSSRSGGVVWSVPHALGSVVMKGAVIATLVNCADAFLEARIAARDEASIQPGQPVVYRFAGEGTERRGIVAFVRGGGVRDEMQTVAHLAPNPRSSGDGRVVIVPDVATLDASPSNSCQVGRSAKIRFGRRGVTARSIAAR